MSTFLTFEELEGELLNSDEPWFEKIQQAKTKMEADNIMLNFVRKNNLNTFMNFAISLVNKIRETESNGDG